MLKLLKPRYLNSIYPLIVGNHQLSNGTIVKLSESDVEQIYLFIHYILVKNYLKNFVFTRDEVEIHSNVIHHQIFNSRNSANIINLLKDKNILFVNGSYIVKKKCKGYRLNFYSKEILIDSYSFKIEKQINQNKFNLFFDKSRNSIINSKFESNFRDIQLNFIEKLTLDFNLLNNNINELIQDKKMKNKTSKSNVEYLNYLNYVNYECHSFELLKYFNLFDTFSGRFYNYFTNKPSKIRDCFLLNGLALSSLDIKSSQIYFLTQLSNLDLSDFKIDSSRIIIDDSFKNEVLFGDIYSFIGKEMNIDRDKAKIQLLSYLYGDKRIKLIPKLFKEHFPNIYNTLKYLKSFTIPDARYCYTIKIKHKLVVKNNYLNYILQSIERDVFLKSLSGLDNYYTVHDSVYFELGREKEFKYAIESYFKFLGLDIPKLC